MTRRGWVLAFAIVARSWSAASAQTGSLEGVWEMLDSRTKQCLRVVSFDTGGKAQLMEQGGRGVSYARWQLSGEQLTLSPANDESRRGYGRYAQDGGERGTVAWESSRLFHYTTTGGNAAYGGDPEPRTYECRRVSSPDKDEDFDNLIGTWRRVGSSEPGCKFASDGTCGQESDPRDGTRWVYRYRRHILTRMGHSPEGRITGPIVGQVTWLDSSHFRFRSLSADTYQRKSEEDWERVSAEEPVFRGNEPPPLEGAVDSTWARRGELAGVWLGKDTTSGLALRVVEFGADSKFNMTAEHDQRIEGTWTATEDTLRTFERNRYRGRGGEEQPLEDATVEWLGSRRLRVTVNSSSRGGGYGSAVGKQFDYFRCGAKDGPEDAANLVNGWERRDEYGQVIRMRLNSDGTCEYSQMRGVGSFFRYQDHILSIYHAHGGAPAQLTERGRVFWVSKNRFRLQLLDGLMVDARKRGTVVEFESQ